LRSRIPHKTQRVLARLSRRAHRFHQFAHHPLCGNYAGEVVRIGRTRLCRGCTYAIAGGLFGGACAIAQPSLLAAVLAIAAATVMLLVSAKRRSSKLATRFAPAGLFAYAIATGVLAWRPLGYAAAGLAVVVVGGLRLAYGKRGPNRTPCVTCPERTLQPCSGFAPIVLRERAFQRLARKYL